MRFGRNTVESSLLAAISGWEFAALTTGRVPTVTSMVLRMSPGGRRMVVGFVSLWLVDHFQCSPNRDTSHICEVRDGPFLDP